MTSQDAARVARLVTGSGGLPMIAIDTPSASAKIYLHGAHVTSWRPRHGSSDVLWMSELSRFEPGSPIRGGIPLCFPWFGIATENPPAPQHGFARIVPWDYLGSTRDVNTVTCSFRLTDSRAASASHWAHEFEAVYTVTVGTELTLRLDVTNTGSTTFAFEEMLHSYFAIQDASTTTVGGLGDVKFISKDDATPRSDPSPVLVGSGVSRSYRGAGGPVEIDDGSRRIRIVASGAPDAVLWNPGPDIARTFEDFPDDGWKDMVCFESGAIRATAPTVQPGATRPLAVTFAVDVPHSTTY